ncbi:MAG: hypothetical protein KJP23_27455 [Deltaproteobacteria bacterium]|nr:hypothetical protein [Deltaproteobacteria bacterium]
MNSNSLSACPSCVGLLRADVFPAFYKSLPKGRPGETLQMDKEAGCFYHPGKKAVVPCSVCGRFVCALCDVSLNGQNMCPACLEKGKTSRKIKNLENHRTCYDTIALTAAMVSMLIYWFTIFTAPLVIYLTVRHWKSPSSIIPRTKIRFILAFIIAGLQIAGWVVFFSKLVLSA